MLDEPTNDLDTDTLAAVEDVLDGWPGTLVVVSHDRYLLERVTDHQMALLGDGKIRALPRGVDQYLELRESALAGSTITGGGNPVTSASSGPGTRPSPEPPKRRSATPARPRTGSTASWARSTSRKKRSTPRWSRAPPTVDFDSSGGPEQEAQGPRRGTRSPRTRMARGPRSPGRVKSGASTARWLGAEAGPSASLRHRAKGTLRSLGDLHVPLHRGRDHGGQRRVLAPRT